MDYHTILKDVDPNKVFWLKNGTVLRNIHELADSLEFMEESTFSHHINEAKNDFYNWVKEVIGDTKLAEEIVSLKNRQKLVQAVKKRIESVEKKIAKEQTESILSKKPAKTEAAVKETIKPKERQKEEIKKAADKENTDEKPEAKGKAVSEAKEIVGRRKEKTGARNSTRYKPVKNRINPDKKVNDDANEVENVDNSNKSTDKAENADNGNEQGTEEEHIHNTKNHAPELHQPILHSFKEGAKIFLLGLFVGLMIGIIISVYI